MINSPFCSFEYFEVTEFSADLPGVLCRLWAALPADYTRRVGGPAPTASTIIHANPSALAPGTHEPTPRDLETMARHYRPRNELLFDLIGQ